MSTTCRIGGEHSTRNQHGYGRERQQAGRGTAPFRASKVPAAGREENPAPIVRRTPRSIERVLSPSEVKTHPVHGKPTVRKAPVTARVNHSITNAWSHRFIIPRPFPRLCHPTICDSCRRRPRTHAGRNPRPGPRRRRGRARQIGVPHRPARRCEHRRRAQRGTGRARPALDTEDQQDGLNAITTASLTTTAILVSTHYADRGHHDDWTQLPSRPYGVLISS